MLKKRRRKALEVEELFIMFQFVKNKKIGINWEGKNGLASKNEAEEVGKMRWWWVYIG